jgi:hypothetical protein
MRILLAAYATDCIATGSFDLAHDRLADRLAACDVLPTTGVSVRALDDGRVVELAELTLQRAELCLVVAAGPRGDRARRLATVSHPMRALVGPYEIVGRLHGPASTDPFGTVRRRRWVAVTDALVSYRSRDRLRSVAHEAILLNTDFLATTEAIDDLTLETRRHRPVSMGIAVLGRSTRVPALAGSARRP